MIGEKLVPTVPIDQQFCSGCVAFKPDANDASRGHCHFNPPQMILTIPIGAATYSDPAPAWPEVLATDWCYQWTSL